MRQLLGSLVVILIATTASAQQAAPACSSAAHHQFDFWVGDWTVTDSARTVTYGSNQVTREEGGWNLHLVGAFDGRAMVLKGESVSPKGAPQIEWAEWSPYPDGRVRQFWRQSTDGGKTWVVYFDGWYAKR